MNNVKDQFLGFMHTPFLFQELQGLSQFELNIDIIKEFDFDGLNIPQGLPLGKRIEYFFSFYIEQSNNYELLKNNIQIIDNKETLGELDFLLYDKRNDQYIHIEHVYKYYLYDESFKEPIDRFIGPNRDDTLVKKLNKLKDKQLPLLHKEQTKEYLEGLDTNTFEQQVCFKGNIYVPMHLIGKALPIINNACIRGFYVNHELFFKEEEFRSHEYYLPARYDWIIDCNLNETWKSFDEVKEEIELFLKHKKSTLVWMKNKDESKVQSFFVAWW